MTSAISFAAWRSNSISDGVSVRGVGHVPSFRWSKAVDGVSEAVALSPFVISPAVFSNFMMCPGQLKV